MSLPPLINEFIAHFGEMGSRWGVNRTVGQIYALLFVSREGRNADEIAELLGFSRSNVGMGLKELQAWRLVRVTHRPGDRREYFEAPQDVWQIFRALVEERRRREIEPTLSMLRDALIATPGDAQEGYAQARMREMHDLIELSSAWFNDVQRLSPEQLRSLMRLGSKVQRVLDIKDRIAGGGTEQPR